MSALRFFRYDDLSWLRETCPVRDGGANSHCWHRGSSTYASFPGQRDERCCFCGETVRVQDKPIDSAAWVLHRGEHGDYLDELRPYFASSTTPPTLTDRQEPNSQ